MIRLYKTARSFRLSFGLVFWSSVAMFSNKSESNDFCYQNRVVRRYLAGQIPASRNVLNNRLFNIIRRNVNKRRVKTSLPQICKIVLTLLQLKTSSRINRARNEISAIELNAVELKRQIRLLTFANPKSLDTV